METGALYVMVKIKLIGLVSLVVLTGCQQEADEVVDWIEVPLSEATYFSVEGEVRQESFEILVLRESALEFKLGMKAGDAIVYNWDVEMAQPELLTAEFHGHTERVGDAPGTVMFYTIHTNGNESGNLVAPFDGIHGWYLNNESNEDIVVRLHVAGYFDVLE